MTSITVPRLTNPGRPIKLNLASPFLRGVEIVWLANGLPINLAKGSISSTVGNPRALRGTNGRHGMGAYKASTDYVTTPTNKDTNGWTIALIACPTESAAIATASYAGTCEDPGSATNDRSIQTSAAGYWSSYIYDGGFKYCISTLSPTAWRTDVIVASCSGTSLTINVNGLEATPTAVANAGYTGYSTPEFCLGYANNVAVYPFYSPLVVRVNAYWNAQMRREFALHPWQIFVPQKRAVYFTAPESAVSATRPRVIGQAVNRASTY